MEKTESQPIELFDGVCPGTGTTGQMLFEGVGITPISGAGVGKGRRQGMLQRPKGCPFW